MEGQIAGTCVVYIMIIIIVRKLWRYSYKLHGPQASIYPTCDVPGLRSAPFKIIKMKKKEKVNAEVGHTNIDL